MGWRRQVPRFFAGFLTVIAILSALAALRLASGPEPVRKLIDLVIVPVPRNLAYAAFVALLAAATARRKRIAWWILVVYFGLQLIADALSLGFIVAAPDWWYVDIDGNPIDPPRWDLALNIAGLVITVLLLVVLLLARREFNARVQRASPPKALAVYAVFAVASVGLGYLLLRTFPGTVAPGDWLVYSADRVFGGLHLGLRPPSQGAAPRVIRFLLGLMGAVSLLAAFFTLFRSQRKAALLHPEEEVTVRQLLRDYGERDSLGYFATRRDKSVAFAPNGKAAVTYRPVTGVSLASADPIGDPEAWGPAIDAWLAETRSHGWAPAVMGASEEGAIAYAKHGLKVMELGDEAIVYVRDFQLDGRDMRPVRQAVHRIERLGYTARVRRHDEVPAEELAHAAELAEQWRDTEAERGFSMALSRLNDPWDGQCVLVEALDQQGKQAAILSFVPWGRKGLSLDLMRRDREADNGLMEFMVASLVKEAPRLRVERISLNFAVFRSTFEEGARIGAGPIRRAWRRTLLFLSRWWQLESLYRANAKYHPQWEPRFLCFGERRDLVSVGMAAAIAEGFLTLPGQHQQLTQPPPPAELSELVAQAARVPTAPQVKRPEQVRVRLAKLERQADPYPIGYPRTHSCAQAAQLAQAAQGPAGEPVAVAGRVILLRDHGKLLFATIRDWSGDVQVLVGPQLLAEQPLDLDVGDHVGVAGRPGRSDKGEPTVFADSWQLTAKCLHPLPDKRGGLTDPEAMVRQRYLDLIVNPASRQTLRARSAAVASLRDTLREHSFIEVETPMLQPVHGGANARPFTTHINAYDMQLYLRIAPELYLKRLCVGGLERVFELGRTFRNEGVSFKHNPEFTMLEAYQAYADYLSMMELTRELIQKAARAALGGTVIQYAGTDYDLGGDWPAISLNDAISAALGEEVTCDTSVSRLRQLAEQADVPFDPKWGHGELILELYERLVEHHTKAPTFYKDFPTDVSPLTRPHRVEPRLAERWDLVAFGTELGTAYSELIDPVEQRRRLTEQSLKAAGGDAEAMELDEDFLEALEYAMPPTGGLGIGVDRVVMLLTGRTIRETLPFPLVRPVTGGSP